MNLPQGVSAARHIGHILPSMGASLGANFSNALNLPQSQSAVVLLVDGLGLEQLERYSAHAPFLRSVLRRQSRELTEMTTVYPSTTAAALTTLGTGVLPGQHGIVGYEVFDPQRQVVVNQLGGWDERTQPEKWQTWPSIFEQMQQQAAQGQHALRAVTVSLPPFEASALTRASLSGAEFLGDFDMGQRFNLAASELEKPGVLVYLYLNELDKAGHAFGPGSDAWLAVLEDIDSHTRRFSRKLRRGVLAALSGDHGMIEVLEDHRIDYAQDEQLIEHIAHTAGEPRMVQLHFDPSADLSQREKTLQAWHTRYGDRAWIATREQAIQAGWFGPVADHVRPRIGDIIVAGHADIALYDSRRAAPQSFAMVGHHGAPTSAELRVPWLMLNEPT